MKLVLTLVLFAFAGLAEAAPIVPQEAPGGTEGVLDFRLFEKHEDVSFYLEGLLATEVEGRQLREATAGLYYRVEEHLKLGLFYRRAYGLRHDEDWVNPAPSSWVWQDTRERGEDFVILDATPRMEFAFLPGKTWVGELKSRLLHNVFNHQDQLFFRPGLTYHWLGDEGRPLASVFVQYELDLPVSGSHPTVADRWLYLGAIHRFAPWLDLGAYGALRWQTWGSTPDFEALGGEVYRVTTQSFVLGATAIFQFEL